MSQENRASGRTRLVAQPGVQPSAGIGPKAIGRSRPNVQSLGGLRDRQPGKVAQFHELRGFGIGLGKPAQGFVQGQKVVVGLRPEHLEVVGPEKDGVSARVDVVEPTGQDTLLHTDFGGTPLTVSVRRRLVVAPGEQPTLRVRWSWNGIVNPARTEETQLTLSSWRPRDLRDWCQQTFGFNCSKYVKAIADALHGIGHLRPPK